MQVLDFGDYQLKWRKEVAPTVGALSVAQTLFTKYANESGVMDMKEDDDVFDQMKKSQILAKKMLDDDDFLQVIDETFDVSKAELIGDEKYQSRLKVPLSQVLNSTTKKGSGIDINKLKLIRAQLINFISVG